MAQAFRRFSVGPAKSTVPLDQPRVFSPFSSPAIPNSGWCSADFMLGAGMVIIQPATGKLVLIWEAERKYWFLPKGRKDRGETLEQAALREAYEESGYKVEFLPMQIPNRAPLPPGSREEYHDPSIEPIYLSTQSWGPRRRGDTGGEYVTAWYIGQIAADAVPKAGTGMADEQHYTSHLLDIHEVLAQDLHPMERKVIQYAWHIYERTIQYNAWLEEEQQKASTSTPLSETPNSKGQADKCTLFYPAFLTCYTVTRTA
ncbi:NUDIX hydrolase domain-like protein [Infundibulicybe gibba]|nr:NUDIX hydrolase domain-like protein [Infundibulicybe gibba]